MERPADLCLRQLRKWARKPQSRQESDRELLERFTTQRDEEAFAELVDRHGPMIFRLCRRILRDAHAAEDAFQAAFLALTRRATSIRRRDSLAGWLYRVAYRIAITMKGNAGAGRQGEPPCTAASTPTPLEVASAREWYAALDEELHGLAARYQEPIVLCYVEEQTRDQAARQLGLSIRTLQRRLEKGRELLRHRLTRRGITLSGALLTAGLAETTAGAAVSVSLKAATARAAVTVALGGPGALTGRLAQMFVLADGIVKATAAPRLALMLALALGTAVAGAGLVAYQTAPMNVPAAQPAARALATATPPAAEGSRCPRNDRFGDPLPDGAIARLGSLRLRHADTVRGVAFLPGDKMLVSADWHGVVVWDTATGKELRHFGNALGRQFQSIAFCADGRTVALSMSHAEHGHVEIWDATQARQLSQFATGRFPNVVLAPDGRVLAIEEYSPPNRHTLRLCSVPTRQAGPSLIVDDTQSHHFVFSSDGKMLVTRAPDEATVVFWDVATGKVLRRFKGGPQHLVSMALSPDNKVLAVNPATKRSGDLRGGGSYVAYLPKEEVQLLDARSGKLLHSITCLEKFFTGFGFAPDSKTVLFGDGNGVHFVDVATGKEARDRRLTAARADSFAYSQDRNTLATGSLGGTIRLWDLATGKELLGPRGSDGQIFAVAVSPDGQTVATGGAGGAVQLWSVRTGEPLRVFQRPGPNVLDVAFTPAGRSLLTAATEQPARAWDIATGKESALLPAELKGTSHLNVAPNGRLAALCGETALVLCNLPEKREFRRLPPADIAAFAPDGRSLFTWGRDKKVHYWDVESGKEVRRFEGHHFVGDSQDRIYAVAFSPNGKLVAFGGQLNSIALYSLATGEPIASLTDLPGAVSKLAFSPDSRLLASGDWSGGTADPTHRGPIHLWEIATGQEIRQLNGHHGRVLALAFAPDGRFLVSGSADGTALVWDVALRSLTTPAPSQATSDAALCWSDLAEQDAGRAFGAMAALARRPKATVEYLHKRLRPVPPADAAQLSKRIRELDSDDFAVRETAGAALAKLAEAAELALVRAVARPVSAEIKDRIEFILSRLEKSPERLRLGRALQILEQIDNAESRGLLTEIAGGAPDAWRTQEAAAALKRLRGPPLR